jgi:hypothetical protein
MSSNDQPYIDPSETALEEAAVQRFKNPSDAFWSGIRDAAGAPALGRWVKPMALMFGLLPLLRFLCSPYQGR